MLVTLHSPREKFWGVLLELTVAGVSVRGIDLNSFDDFTAMVRAGDPASPTTAFFPLARVERVELDTANGTIPSLSERFAEVTGRLALRFLLPSELAAEETAG
ncbi:MAG TPA: hypothetical protein VK473_04090 [Terriglobales bacterium]|nr:hypothetical protein [Terriglobales bacterium]